MTTLLLTGKTGQVGSELQRTLVPLGKVIAPGRHDMDLGDPDSIRASLRAARPDIIVNAAGYTTVDKAESEVDRAMRVNAIAPGILAEEAKRLGALLVHYSTDYVYDGAQEQPYGEDCPPHPLNAYGVSKLAGDHAIEATGVSRVILRTSWVYGMRRPNFVLTILRLAREKPELAIVEDQAGSPSWARALAEATAALLRRRERLEDNGGVYHLSAAGHTTRYEFARTIIRTMQEITGSAGGWASVRPIKSEEFPLPAQRPRHLITSKDKIKQVFGIEMPPWETQLRSFLAEVSVSGGGRLASPDLIERRAPPFGPRDRPIGIRQGLSCRCTAVATRSSSGLFTSPDSA